MSTIYENPPIVEAICEFRFEPGQPWDLTVPGLAYAKLKGEFPKRRGVPGFQVEWLRGSGPTETAQGLASQIARIQFLREDEKALVQVADNFLAINHLKPYPAWQVFREMISRGLEAYREVAIPKGFKRIGLRYINRIAVPEERVEIEDFLVAVPKIPAVLPQVFAAWAQRVEVPFEDANGVLALQSGSVKGEEAAQAFLLDLDFTSLKPQEVTLDKAMDWVERAHELVENAFEACITPRARELFKEVQHDHGKASAR
jgi:uncharacterized protein (TIGR04255 family)